MRPIKFRALPLHGHGFVYGYYRFVTLGEQAYQSHKIAETETRIEHDVDETSLGQFIGSTDANGTDIYEGDIIKSETNKLMVVEWNNRLASFCLAHPDWVFRHYFGEAIEPQKVTVVGNIHQHMHMLNAQKP